jgi:HD-GYP domain-containing protein (c-di-GMP phosphodiesterase class II)
MFDGRGYPDGLRGDQIPIGSRILSVADSYDTMVSDRAYKAARPFGEALDELRRCAGTQFDPAIVEAFLESLRVFGDPRMGAVLDEQEVETAQ